MPPEKVLRQSGSRRHLGLDPPMLASVWLAVRQRPVCFEESGVAAPPQHQAPDDLGRTHPTGKGRRSCPEDRRTLSTPQTSHLEESRQEIPQDESGLPRLALRG